MYKLNLYTQCFIYKIIYILYIFLFKFNIKAKCYNIKIIVT